MCRKIARQGVYCLCTLPRPGEKYVRLGEKDGEESRPEEIKKQKKE